MTTQILRVPSPSTDFEIIEDGAENFSLMHDVADASLAAREELCRNIISTTETTEPFFVTDLGDVHRKHERWVAALPSVHPFYAVKCNPDMRVVETLAVLGTNFDCASKKEIEMVLSVGVSADRIIFAHPCKAIPHLLFAKKVGVTKMTFDNDYELNKIAACFPEAELVLRILVDDSKARCRLGLKFGAELKTCAHLLNRAASLGLNVVGVSFHVGSGACDSSAYSDAIARARTVFDLAVELGHTPTLLDIGGGFPGDLPNAATAGSLIFEDVAEAVNSALDTYFYASDAYPSVSVIGEPGRFFVHSASSIAVNIVSKRKFESADAIDEALGVLTTSSTSSFMYYINDGVYGSFNCIVFDHATPVPGILIQHNKADDGNRSFKSSVWGPTCDSIDLVCPSANLPELEIGDWLVFHNMGAYTNAAATTFNGFQLTSSHYTISTSSSDVEISQEDL